MQDHREYLHLLSEYVTDFREGRKKGVSLPSDPVKVTVAGDDLAPAAPTMSGATAVPEGVKVEWVNPSTNADGTTCYDQKWSKIYHHTATGVTKTNYSGTYVMAGRAGDNQAFTDSGVTTDLARYYIVTAIDGNGNESAASSEANASGGSIDPTTSIPDDASGLIFDDTVGTEGVVVGDGMLGIVFQQPATSWQNFDHYRLWYAEDSGGGFGSWSEITPVNRIGYVHKGLNTGYDYRYKATVVATDGTESSTEDKSKSDDSGHTPDGADNSLIVAELILAETIVATDEVRAAHIKAGTITGDRISSSTTITAGSGNSIGVLDGADATYRIYAGHATPASAPFRVTQDGDVTATSATISGKVTITDAASSGIGTFSDAGALATADTVGASDCDATIISGGKIITGLLTASNIQTGTLDCDQITVSNLDANQVIISGATYLDDWRHASDATKIDGGDIYANSITATQINADTITANEIAVGTITATEITGSALSDIYAALGSITSGTVTGLDLATQDPDDGAAAVMSATGGFGTAHRFEVYDANRLRSYMQAGAIYLAATDGDAGILIEAGTYGEINIYNASGTSTVELNGTQQVIYLKERSGAPTAQATYGALYTKSTNKLFFQDGGGTEHEIAYA